MKFSVFRILLFFFSLYALWTNEHRIYTVSEKVDYLKGIVAVDSNEVLESNEGKDIYINGKIRVTDLICDDDFDFGIVAVELSRSVNVYEERWVKQKGSFKSSYVEKRWVPSYNGGYRSYIKTSSSAYIGSYKLDESILRKCYDLKTLDLSEYELNLPDSVKLVNKTQLYIGKQNLDNPALGDIKITYHYTPLTELSFIANQQNGELFVSDKGFLTGLIYEGNITKDKILSVESEKEVDVYYLILGGAFIAIFFSLFNWFRLIKRFWVSKLPIPGFLRTLISIFVVLIISLIIHMSTITFYHIT